MARHSRDDREEQTAKIKIVSSAEFIDLRRAESEYFKAKAESQENDHPAETAELPLTVAEVPLDGPTLRGDYDPEPPQELKLEPLEDAVSRAFAPTPEEVRRVRKQAGGAEPFEDAVSRAFPVTDEEVRRARERESAVSPEPPPESGPFSLRLGTDDYQPMYKGGPYVMDKPKPKPPPPPPRPDAFGRIGDEFSGLVEMAGPEPVPERNYGPLALALVGVVLGLVATTLALWVFMHGCNCATPAPITQTVTPTPQPGP